MKTSRMLSATGALLLSALVVPLVAAARPPQPAAAIPPLPSFTAVPPTIVGPHLIVTRLSSAPTHARAGQRYGLRGMVVNEGSVAARGRVVVHLLRVGGRPLAVGRATVALAAHGSAVYRARIRVPLLLNAGSYALVACARRGGQTGELGCATA